MKRLILLPLLLSLIPVAKVDINNSRHEQCLNAADYAGCMKYKEGTDSHSQLEKYREKDARIKAVNHCSNKDYLLKQIMKSYQRSIYYESMSIGKRNPQKYLERNSIKPSTYWEEMYRKRYDKCFNEKFEIYK